MSLDKIKKRIKVIKDLQLEAKKVKVNFDDSFNNSRVVQEFQAKQEELKTVISEYKEKVENVKEQPVLKAMLEDLKDLKTEIKENKEVLAQELADYYKETGTLEIVDTDGTKYIIKFAAKLTSN